MYETSIDYYGTRVEHLKAEVGIDLPKRSTWDRTLLPLVALGAWTMLGVSLAYLFQVESAMDSFNAAVRSYLPWGVLWLVGDLALTALVLWVVAGRERVVLNAGYLRLRFSVGQIAWTRDYDVSLVRHLRVKSPPMEGLSIDEVDAEVVGAKPRPPRFALMFDYGDQMIVFAKGMSEETAEYVRTVLGKQVPSVLR